MIAQGHGLVARRGREKRNVLTDVVLDDAQRAMIASNTGLAGLAAKVATKRWRVDNDDAYASALLGLIAAAVRFDESRGTAFSSYAVKSCMRQIYTDLIRRPMYMGRMRVWSMDDDNNDRRGRERRRSLHKMIAQHRERTPIEQLMHDETMAEARKWIDEITAESDRMHTVIRIRTDGGTLQEAGDALGVTHERARQLEAQHVGEPFARAKPGPKPKAIAS